MGAEEHQIGTPIDNNVLALLITGQSARFIEKMKDAGTENWLTNPINFQNDTILHYACAKNNKEVVEYLSSRNADLLMQRNNNEQLPSDLATDNNIKVICDAALRRKA